MARLSKLMAPDVRLILPIATVVMILLMILPLPAFVLDVLISINIAFSLITMLTAVSLQGPLQFSVLPSILLLATVMRLGLNLASTRRILLHGAEGTEAAGNVIEAFGNFVVGGNMVVGAVVFLVLLAVQFIVINHGANRISEVSARFTLDAMPGKQMSIDADLNAGIIDEREATARRSSIQREADFYGSMDGAVKFTQRDAIASLIIVSINIIAGFAIGVGQSGMRPLEAVETYTILTVGDGLVSAIPALLISIAGALITTRSGSENELSVDLAEQLLKNETTLSVAAGSLFALGLVPGLPFLLFGGLAAAAGGGAYLARKRTAAALAEPAPSEDTTPAAEEPIEPLLAVDPLTIEVGYDLVTLAGSESSGGLLDRIRKLRRQVAQDLGIVVPPVRIRDNLNLRSDEYRVMMRGVEIARSRLRRNKSLAISTGDVIDPIEGEATKDPSFGIPALWIDDSRVEDARERGYTIVDLTSVLVTHLSELIRRHAGQLLGRQEVQRLLELLGKSAPKLVEELVPESYTVGQIQKVLRGLLQEQVSIRDMETICETLADCAGQQQTMDSLVSRVRQGLSRSIVQPMLDGQRLSVITLSNEFEQDVRKLLDGMETEAGLVAPNPRHIQEMVHKVAQGVQQASPSANQAILVSDPQSRLFLRKVTERVLPNIPFLAVQEVPDGVSVNAIGRVG